MEKIYQYIDRCLIDNDITDTDQLSDHEFSNFLNLLMSDDTDIRQIILVQMQKLLDERNKEAKLNRRFQAGIQLYHLSNGDIEFKSINL